MGLAARAVNVFFAPRKAYEAVAARPRALGALAIAIAVLAGANYLFLSSEVGKNLAFEQQTSVMQTFGITLTPEAEQRLAQGVENARFTTPISLIVIMPIAAAAVAGILMAIFTVVTGGGARYKQIYAVVAHSYLIGALQQAFSLPIMYLKNDMTSPTALSVFAPMLSDEGFAHHLLRTIDLFYLWSTINVAIGIAVVYKRPTGGVAAVLLGIYATIALIYAAVRAF